MSGRQFVYDAWNRLVEVKDATGATLKSYAYDGLHRRVQETAGGTTTDLYYSDAWQVLEERVGGQAQAQYVWSPVYVDALVLRDRDTNGDGTLDERLWVAQDANYNVTALFDNAGNVVERYVYDPFGQATVLDANWNVLAGSTYAWVYLHQGGRFDATSGLYHFRHRDYSPTLGRWTSLDPLSYAAGDVNLYRVVFNAPTVYTDPSGQIVLLPILLIGGAILTLATSVAVNSGLPERIGEAYPETFAGPSNDFFGRWAHRVERRTVSGFIEHNLVGIPDGSVELVTIIGSQRYRSVSFGQPGHTSSYWQYVFRGRPGMWVGRVFLVAFVAEGIIDGVVVVESAIETFFD